VEELTLLAESRRCNETGIKVYVEMLQAMEDLKAEEDIQARKGFEETLSTLLYQDQECKEKIERIEMSFTSQINSVRQGGIGRVAEEAVTSLNPMLAKKSLAKVEPTLREEGLASLKPFRFHRPSMQGSREESRTLKPAIYQGNNNQSGREEPRPLKLPTYHDNGKQGDREGMDLEITRRASQ